MVRFAMVQPLRIGDSPLRQNEMNMPCSVKEMAQTSTFTCTSIRCSENLHCEKHAKTAMLRTEPTKCSQASFAHLWPTARPVAGPGPWSSKALEMQRLSSSKQLRQDIYKKKTDQTSTMRKNRITSCEVFKALAVAGRPTSEAKWKYSNVLQLHD